MTGIGRIRIILPARYKAEAGAIARAAGEEIARAADRNGGAPPRIAVQGGSQPAAALPKAIGRAAGGKP